MIATTIVMLSQLAEWTSQGSVGKSFHWVYCVSNGIVNSSLLFLTAVVFRNGSGIKVWVDHWSSQAARWRVVLMVHGLLICLSFWIDIEPPRFHSESATLKRGSGTNCRWVLSPYFARNESK